MSSEKMVNMDEEEISTQRRCQSRSTMRGSDDYGFWRTREKTQESKRWSLEVTLRCLSYSLNVFGSVAAWPDRDAERWYTLTWPHYYIINLDPVKIARNARRMERKWQAGKSCYSDTSVTSHKESGLILQRTNLMRDFLLPLASPPVTEEDCVKEGGELCLWHTFSAGSSVPALPFNHFMSKVNSSCVFIWQFDKIFFRYF